MQRTIQCPCGRILVWAEGAAGHSAACPHCGQVFSPAVPHAVPRAEPVLALEEEPDLDAFDFRAGQVEQPATPRPAPALYSPLAAAAAGLTGGVLGGAIVLGLNFAALRNKAAAVLVILAGVLVTAAVSVLLPDYLDLPVGAGAAGPFAAAAAAQLAAGAVVSFAAAWLFQGRAARRHRHQRGEFVPVLRAVSFPAACAVLVFGLQFLSAYPFACGGVAPTRTVYYGRGQRLVYSVGIPRELAYRAGDVLAAHGVFQDGGPVDVFLLSRGDHVELRFFVDEAVWNHGGRRPGPDPELGEHFREVRGRMMTGPFRGTEVWVVICNPFGKQLDVIR